MIINMTGGGGSDLNFKVVGGTEQPSSPSNNTIWVNTDEIESYVFSATEPESPVAGMVWIEVGTESEVAFNLMKKNAIYIYPASVKQYDGSTWADVFAHIYQNGTWAQFSEIVTELVLYNAGSFPNGELVTQNFGHTPGITKNTDSVTIEATYAYGSTSAGAYLTSSKINLTTYKNLSINVSSAKNMDRGTISIAVYSDYSNSSVIARADISSTGALSLSLADITGSYYVGLQTYNAYNANVPSVTFTKLWLE